MLTTYQLICWLITFYVILPNLSLDGLITHNYANNVSRLQSDFFFLLLLYVMSACISPLALKSRSRSIALDVRNC